MSTKSQFERAAEQMRQLLAEDVLSKVKTQNEATNRLLLIDKVLCLLGWFPEEYNPEHALPTRDYTDYQLKIDGHTRLIVEAKRVGPVQPLPVLLQHSEYTNATLYNNCGKEMKALIDQYIRYCAITGVNYALATSGEVWIILLASRTDFDWNKLKAFVFHSLEDINERFTDFYSLVSREAVQAQKLEEKFS
jgi:predicted type IV restriction endonuclease